ncbi:hypothetical protein EW146_g6957 [Bondarzewia mesenterica]|uniref:SSD domain-containing protein n=1 Tax=Bondarzewia mesenterica TaxID=1095465 RepID=A0A4S4LMV2_9AGAM|nr:hypothetical protein EW146_g6957 [Bondarzewia mesenterica]
MFTPAVQEGRYRGQMKPAPELIMEALDKVANPILRDYALEIAVLLIGAYSKVGGLTKFCALAALLLTIDCAAMATLYFAVLSLMIEVRRIKMLRTLSRSGTTTMLPRDFLGPFSAACCSAPFGMTIFSRFGQAWKC